MTLQEIVVEIWENLGEPSDLDPYQADGVTIDTGSSGWTKLVDWSNRAYRVISNWKFPNGDQIRFLSLKDVLYVSTALIEKDAGVISSGAADSKTIVFETGYSMSAEDDFYNGWLLEIEDGSGEGQKRLIVDYTGTSLTATVHKDLETALDTDTTISLCKNFMELVNSASSKAAYNIPKDPIDEIAAVLKVHDMEEEVDIAWGDRVESYPGAITTTGNPTEMYRYGNKIVFDRHIQEAKYLRVEYMKIPDLLTEDSDEPVIPVQWHEAIVMWATWKGLKRDQESGEAYSMKRDIEDFMQRSKQEADMMFDRSNANVEVVL